MKKVWTLIAVIALLVFCIGCTPKSPFEVLAKHISANGNSINKIGDNGNLTEIKWDAKTEQLCFKTFYLYDTYTLDVEMPFEYGAEYQKIYLNYHFDDIGVIECSGNIDTYSYSGYASSITAFTCDNYYFYDLCYTGIKTYTQSLFLDVFDILEDANIDVTLKDLGFEHFP